MKHDSDDDDDDTWRREEGIENPYPSPCGPDIPADTFREITSQEVHEYLRQTNICPEGLPSGDIKKLINGIGRQRWNRAGCRHQPTPSIAEKHWLEYHTERPASSNRPTRTGSDCGGFPVADDGSQVVDHDQDGLEPPTMPKPRGVGDIANHGENMSRLTACGLWEVNARQLSALAEPEWECLRITVDSGASDTVVPPSFARNCPLLHSPKVGIEYEVANGESVFNLGEKRCTMRTSKDATTNFLMSFQVVEVHKPLLAVSKLIEAGHQVLFNKENPHILLSTGEKMPMMLVGGTYEVELWIRNPSFIGQSQR